MIKRKKKISYGFFFNLLSYINTFAFLWELEVWQKRGKFYFQFMESFSRSFIAIKRKQIHLQLISELKYDNTAVSEALWELSQLPRLQQHHHKFAY